MTAAGAAPGSNSDVTSSVVDSGFGALAISQELLNCQPAIFRNLAQ